MRKLVLVFCIAAFVPCAFGQKVATIDSHGNAVLPEGAIAEKSSAASTQAATVQSAASAPADPHNLLLPAGCSALQVVTGVVPTVGNSSGPGYTAAGDNTGLTITFTDPTFTNPAVVIMPEGIGGPVIMSTFMIHRTPLSVKLATGQGFLNKFNFVAMRCK